jgi:DNA-directed RNA polymerases I, II, and III subunit RPABC2
MSYFDENAVVDGSDDENKNNSGSDSDDSESDAETNIDENEEVEVDDDDDEAKGLEDDTDDDDNEEKEEKEEGFKINFKEKYGIDFGSNDDEDLITFARKNKEKLKAKYGEDFGNDSEEDLKTFARKYLEEMEEKEKEREKEQMYADDSETEIVPKKKTKKLPTTKQKGPSVAAMLADEEDNDDDPSGEIYLQKFNKEINDNYLVNFHPESVVHNYDEILAMTKVIRDKNGIIIDDLHKTIPYLTKYEKARVLGQRAKQINSGASVFVKVPEKVIDGYLIAELELIEKRVPFIIRRPLPNGGSEYWSIKDLENISF